MGRAKLDHIEIATTDLSRSCHFYASVFGFVVGNPPAPLPAETIQWLFDEEGRPVIHLVFEEAPLRAGMLKHIALLCTDKAEIVRQLDAIDATYEVINTRGAPVDLIFTRDPSGVTLELKFEHA